MTTRLMKKQVALVVAAIVVFACCALVACQNKASAEPLGPPWGVKIARVPDGDVWRVEDGNTVCYVVGNNQWNNTGHGISCVRSSP